MTCLFAQAVAQSRPQGIRIRYIDTLQIRTDRLNAFAIGADLQGISRDDLKAQQAQSLSEVLVQQAGLMVQQYGPGQLASPAMRGTGAAHTAVIWEGFQLQSSFNGQVDLSLFPVGGLNDVIVMPGANAALWGGGAMGGTIFLRYQPSYWEKGSRTRLQLHGGSNGLRYLGGSHRWKKGDLDTRAQVYHRQATNQFRYRAPGTGAIQRQSHAAFQQSGFQHSLRLLFNQYQSLESHIWWGQSDREIPRFAHQKDQHYRQALTWRYMARKVKWTVRTAVMIENLNYEDSIANIFSPNHSFNWITEAEGYYHLGAHRFQGGLHLTRLQAESPNLGLPSLVEYRPALFGSWAWTVNQQLKMTAQVRQGLTGQNWDPIVPSFGFSFRGRKNWELRGRFARNYRVPTFNDRFWNPGGNPDLLPEKGMTAEVGVGVAKARQQIDLTLHSAWIQNWIQWIPGPSYWSPENVGQVWARGLELRWKSRLTKGWKREHLKLNSLLRYQFTQTASYQGWELGPQRIFIPVHQASAYIIADYEKWKLTFGQTWTGLRYTATDHSSALPGYLLGHIHLKSPGLLRSKRIGLSARVDNLWNTDYQVIPGRPMPLRTFQVGIEFKWDRMTPDVYLP